MDMETWRGVWNKGPLFRRHTPDDEQMCFKRHARRGAHEREAARLYQQFSKTLSTKQQDLDASRRHASDANERLFEARFNTEESWTGRAPLDYTRLSDDTILRLHLYEIFGPLPNHPSPPTTISTETLCTRLIQNAVKEGTLPLATQKNLEFWTEAAYFAVANSRVPELAGLHEDFVGHARDRFDAAKVEGGHLISSYRQVLTGFYLPPTSSIVEKTPCSGEDLMDAGKVIAAVTANLPLLVWYRGEHCRAMVADKRVYLAEQRGVLALRREFASELRTRKMVNDKGGKEMDASIRDHEDALERIERNDVAWRKVQIHRVKTGKAEESHLLQSIPLSPMQTSPYLVERDVPKETKVSKTFQHHLAELLSNAVYKKCLVAGDAPQVAEMRSALYENAWLLAKQDVHEIYSAQRVDIGEMLQTSRRRVETAVRAITGNSRLSGTYFAVENNTTDRRDVLFAPDQYADDLKSM